MSAVDSPFRADDAVARLQALRDRRDALRAELRALASRVPIFFDDDGRKSELHPLVRWQFVGGVQKVNAWASYRDAPARTPESDALSKALVTRGCKFVGSTIMYAFMQAVGIVDDHETGCFRRAHDGSSTAP